MRKASKGPLALLRPGIILCIVGVLLGIQPAHLSAAEDAPEATPARWLEGRVLDGPTSKPLQGVSVISVDTKPTQRTFWSSQAVKSAATRLTADPLAVTTGRDGRFRVADPDGTTGLIFLKEHYYHYALHPDEMEKHTSNGVLIVPMRPGAITLTGTYLEDGKPAPCDGILIQTTNPYVFPGTDETGGTTGGPSQATLGSPSSLDTDTKGRFKVTRLPTVYSWSLDPDAKGRFKVTGLAPGPHHLYTSRITDGARIRPITRDFTLKQGHDLHLALGSDLGSCMITGRVCRNGSPLPHVVICLEPRFDSEYKELQYLTDAYGRYAMKGLKEGRYRMGVSPHPSEIYREEMDDLVVSGDANRDLTIGEHVVRVHFVFAGPSSGLRRPTLSQCLFLITKRPSSPRTAGSGQASNINLGYATLSGLFQGDYLASVSIDLPGMSLLGHEILHGKLVKLDNTQGNQEIEITLPDVRMYSLTCRIVDAQGVPVERALVHFEGLGPELKGPGLGYRSTDAEGLTAAAVLPGSRYLLRAEDELKKRKAEIEVDLKQDFSVDIRLP